MECGRKFIPIVLLGVFGVLPVACMAAAAGEGGAKPPAKDAAPTSRDALFGDDKSSADSPKPAAWGGFIQTEVARAYRDPEHWSKARLRLEVTGKGQFSERVKWTIGGRFDYDAAYAHSNFYPPEVRKDQRNEFTLRETYLDISAGDWEIRVGRQHVVWGEMVGLFFADVVSAKDMREFLLPEFGQLRIPQWAARAEYFKNDVHAELLWIPVPTIDKIGKPGADFYPYPLPVPSTFLGEEKPAHKLSNSNYGFRMSQVKNGWDVSGFYYHSVDSAPTFYNVNSAGLPFVFQPRHDKINQVGGTLAKDLGEIVLKGEIVYTDGRKFNVTRISQPSSLVEQKTFDYAVGLDFNLPADTRFNVQFFQRIYFDHDPDIIPDKRESGFSWLLNSKFGQKVEAQALLVHSVNRSDWMFRPQLSWNFEKNWRLLVGADVFGGPPTGFFGRYNNNDRVYTEVRYSF